MEKHFSTMTVHIGAVGLTSAIKAIIVCSHNFYFIIFLSFWVNALITITKNSNEKYNLLWEIKNDIPK